MKNNKKKRFYKNKNRNQHWTEPEVGRPIDFADKYIPGDEASDKYDFKRNKKNNSAAKKERARKNRRRALTALACVAVICIGYIGADVFIIRHAEPARNIIGNAGQQGDLNALAVTAQSLKTESLSLDGAVMLSSVIDEAISAGYTSVTFDAKRSDGTVGYLSELALVDTFGAASSPATDFKGSVSTLLENDILPIARVSCWRDNIAPPRMQELALMNGDTLYQDKDGNTYLNPDSEYAYNYIKDIIQECSNNGVTVFLLTDCALPSDIAEGHSGGFELLSAKLSADLGTSVKLLCEADASVAGIDAETGEVGGEAIEAELSALSDLTENHIYYISTELDSELLRPYLEAAGIESYIIENI